MGKVIFESGVWHRRRYEVQYRESGGYRWEPSRGFAKKASAFSHAENLLQERGISDVRVVDVDADGED